MISKTLNCPVISQTFGILDESDYGIIGWRWRDRFE